MEKIKQKSYELVADNWVNKSNALNEVRNNRMTISQIRLFTIYLSKINPKNIESREVIFKLDEYAKIMQFKKANTTKLIKAAEKLLGLTVKYWDKTGEYSSDGLKGFVMCQIFKRFKLYKNDEGGWMVSIECHDDVVRLMFDLQKYYFKYQLWNALQLTSPNQQRMYEILKQYEFAGKREVKLTDLREWLGLKPEEYSLWQNFKVRVLEASQESLARYTDIKFTWEVAGKRGKGGKINAIKFYIEKNNDYVRQLTLNEYLTELEQVEYEYEPEEFECPDVEGNEGEHPKYVERIKLFMDACYGEFTYKQVITLNDMLRKILSSKDFRDQTYCFHYLQDRCNEMRQRAERAEIKNRLGYLKKLIGASL